MKTPIQELIQTFEEMNTGFDPTINLRFAIALAKSMIKREKEVMNKTWDEGAVCLNEFKTFEEYYNTTFNTKEK